MTGSAPLTPPSATPDPAAPADPAQLLRSREYLVLLVFSGVIGVPVAIAAYVFLYAVGKSQTFVFTTLPSDLGFDSTPTWWPLPVLALGGLLVALVIRHLPGMGGHSPADGLKTGGGPAQAIDLPGIVAAAFVTLSAGVVLGPEAPLIALGGGLGAWAVHLAKKDAPPQAAVVIGLAGSFAAVSTLLGSPIVGAFLLMEMVGIGGAMMGVVLVPGLLAAGIGSLIFVGLDNWTGFGTFSLAISGIPAFGTPTLAEFLWAIGIGVAAAMIGAAIHYAAKRVRTAVTPHMVFLMPILGLAIASLAILFEQTTNKDSSLVLFSGQSALAPLIHEAGTFTAGALVMLLICKGLAYGLSLSSFRGGPVFPGVFLGATMGIALSHLPGLPMIAGAGMGMGAMTAAMLGMPLTAVLLTTVFLGSDGLDMMPIVIVAVVVSYVASARLQALIEPPHSHQPASPESAGEGSKTRPSTVKAPAPTR